MINYLVHYQVWPEKQNSKCRNRWNISIWRQLLPLQSCHCQLHSENFNSIAESIARNQISKTCYWWTQMGRFIKWRWKLIKKSQYQSLSLKTESKPYQLSCSRHRNNQIYEFRIPNILFTCLINSRARQSAIYKLKSSNLF